MKKLQFDPHTADVRLKIEADTLEELLQAGLEGMSGILRKDICPGLKNSDIKIALEISSGDSTALMVDFLSEVLTLSHINSAVFCELKMEKLTSQHLQGVVRGQSVDYFDEDIKAVTYHEAEVRQDADQKWRTNIIFDI